MTRFTCKNCGLVIQVKQAPYADQRAKEEGYCCADCQAVYEAVKELELKGAA